MSNPGSCGDRGFTLYVRIYPFGRTQPSPVKVNKFCGVLFVVQKVSGERAAGGGRMVNVKVAHPVHPPPQLSGPPPPTT